MLTHVPASEIKPRSLRLASLVFGVERFNYAPRLLFKSGTAYPSISIFFSDKNIERPRAAQRVFSDAALIAPLSKDYLFQIPIFDI